MAMKVAINGFGRIGRDVFRIIFEDDYDIDLVAINASGDRKTNLHIFKYDSLYGRFDGDVTLDEEGNFVVNGKTIKTLDERDPEKLPWGELGVDLVIDTTGAFRDREGLSKHLNSGAKKVIVTAPAKGDDITIVMGVNEDKYDPEKHNIISNASCTTNCLAPVAKVLSDTFGIEKGLMTTIHAYTSDQVIHDKKHKDLRRARAAALSIIPTTTGAAKAVALVLPELKGKMNGFAVRVPTPTVSLVDLTVELSKEASKEEINEAMKKASEGDMKGILEYEEDPLVSIDFQGSPYSSIFDPEQTMVMGNMAKVVSWYDNEWGYSKRVVDLAKMIADR
ncbi:MAG: type I glyceraldehyde-3-phosphate dehydrogenase [Tissierellia bacterium]|jgi:glyceraldehyde 3-phosphate dehydrogenase|nr:type I glyceraldehyde-3-phosphate dehydrogenase [Bacillota bacterium]NLK58871.1 type I glyceraldehyde-3-phosphate dehydrogenase [Tissierellia bacterium]